MAPKPDLTQTSPTILTRLEEIPSSPIATWSEPFSLKTETPPEISSHSDAVSAPPDDDLWGFSAPSSKLMKRHKLNEVAAEMTQPVSEVELNPEPMAEAEETLTHSKKDKKRKKKKSAVEEVEPLY
jgi:hypothetical protein